MEFSQYHFGNKVNILMDDCCLERRSALTRCADESKVGDIITAKDIQMSGKKKWKDFENRIREK